ncbi:MAG TPA: hypothetical protein DCY31_09015 [Ruminococcaceae bacterium]|nr:hypothetical protein [Oscillospiraceae bacterium]
MCNISNQMSLIAIKIIKKKINAISNKKATNQWRKKRTDVIKLSRIQFNSIIKKTDNLNK